jgi:hypothetical protein
MLGKVLPIVDLHLKDQFYETPNTEHSENQKITTNETNTFSNKLSDYTGEYISDELATEYNIKSQDGKLIMSHQRLKDMELTEIGKDKFSGTNTFRFELEFLRNGQEVSGFQISNFGAKNVKFKRK